MPSPEQMWLTVSDPQDGVYRLFLLPHSRRGEEAYESSFECPTGSSCSSQPPVCDSALVAQDSHTVTGVPEYIEGRRWPEVGRPLLHVWGSYYSTCWGHLCYSKSILTCALQVSPVSSWLCQAIRQWNYSLWGVEEALSEKSPEWACFTAQPCQVPQCCWPLGTQSLPSFSQV